jgi:arginase family enzyme
VVCFGVDGATVHVFLRGRLASLDAMELNPALDLRNQTALLAVDLIESLFGKSTLMRRRGDIKAKDRM